MISLSSSLSSSRVFPTNSKITEHEGLHFVVTVYQLMLSLLLPDSITESCRHCLKVSVCTVLSSISTWGTSMG